MQVRDINQQFWRHDELPFFELRSTFLSSQPYKAHTHSGLSIGAVVSGQTRLSISGQEQRVEAGDVVIIEPEKVHACNPVDGIPRSYHMLYVDSQWCLSTLSRLYSSPITRLYSDQVLIKDSGLFEQFLKFVKQLEEDNLPRIHLAFEQLAFQVLCHWCSPCDEEYEEDGVAQHIRRRLLKDLTHPPSLAVLAQELGRSQEGIIRLFSKQFGITPKAFVNNARVEKAKLYLRQGLPIVDVSAVVGFSDQSQFHRAFVAHTASTPRQYQQTESIFDNI